MTINYNFSSGNTFASGDSFSRRKKCCFFSQLTCGWPPYLLTVIWQQNEKEDVCDAHTGSQKTLVESTALNEVDNFDSAFHYQFHLRWHSFWCQYFIMNKEIIPNNVLGCCILSAFKTVVSPYYVSHSITLYSYAVNLGQPLSWCAFTHEAFSPCESIIGVFSLCCSSFRQARTQYVS